MVEIDGEKFTTAEVQQKNKAKLFQARASLYEAERKVADEFVNDYLVERQAKREGVTVEELLKRHVTAGKEPSEDTLRAFYEGVDTGDSFESLRDKIAEAIRNRRLAKAKTDYIKSLRAQANVSIDIDAPRVQISLDNTPVRGTSELGVTLVEFADYECPYCQQIQPVIAKLEAEFKGRVAFGFKDVPLPNHASAQKAAEASHCAGEQGKYWEYHDRLFDSKQLAVAQLKDHAQALRLNMDKFNKCLDSGSQADRVKAHFTEAQGVSLPGTPGFFVNGRYIQGDVVDYRFLRQALEEELNAAAKSKGRVERSSVK